MNREISIKSIFSASTGNDDYYLPEDFTTAPKIDAHMHYHTFSDVFLRFAKSVNMHLITINTDIGESIDNQMKIAQSLKRSCLPAQFNFIGTFVAANFESDTFVEDTIVQIKKCMAAGAKGIKIWKNIGMVLKNKDGRYVMADDPIFAPIFEYLQSERITLITHLGEPLNCWQPYSKITLYDDLRYYKNHPQYHMYQHPEAPTYEQQIEARDHILERYPQLRFVGAHLGSLEWNIDEVAKRFDRYPEFYVDLSARLSHVQLQTIQDREKARNFFINYQDRILYGSDWFVPEKSTWIKLFALKLFPGMCKKIICRSLHNAWRNHWLFLATNNAVPAEKFNMPNAPETIEGLQLPKQVIDKIFYENAERVYKTAYKTRYMIPALPYLPNRITELSDDVRLWAFS